VTDDVPSSIIDSSSRRQHLGGFRRFVHNDDWNCTLPTSPGDCSLAPRGSHGGRPRTESGNQVTSVGGPSNPETAGPSCHHSAGGATPVHVLTSPVESPPPSSPGIPPVTPGKYPRRPPPSHNGAQDVRFPPIRTRLGSRAPPGELATSPPVEPGGAVPRRYQELPGGERGFY
jgi:hypothetical protein